MATWAEFETSNPTLAAAGRRLLYRTETGEALLATVRGDDPPRIHPIWVGIVDGRLYAFILKSAKRIDLERDGRYALHSHIDPPVPSEFSIRGRARLIDDVAARAEVGGSWYFEVDETYELFDFDIETAILDLRDNADEWPPRYQSWATE
jgi:hypothetical protein